MKRFLLISSLFFINIITIFAADLDSLQKFSPKIEGTIRAKYEYNTSLGASRFQVRNARFSVNGNFSPLVSYKAEIDLSDEGETKMLDAYLRMKPISWFTFTLGQQKIPFSTDNLRAPHLLYFANRSFIGKQLTGLRDVGATFMFSNKNTVPLDFSVGVYNGDGLYKQQNWKKDNMSYAARLEIFPIKNIEISLNLHSSKPENIRMNLFDAGLYFNYADFHLETEYFYKTYQNNAFHPTKGFFVFGAYDIWTNKKYLQKITPLARFDTMTDNNKGYADKNGNYAVSDVARSRFTGGVTLSLNKPFLNDIRLNYEKYFKFDNEDKLVVEFVVRF